MSQDSRESEWPKAVEAGFEQHGEHAVTGAPASLGACTFSEGATSDGARFGDLKEDEEVMQKPVVPSRLTGIKSKRGKRVSNVVCSTAVECARKQRVTRAWNANQISVAVRNCVYVLGLTNEKRDDVMLLCSIQRMTICVTVKDLFRECYRTNQQ